jgi:hypothetical protein
MKGNQFIGRLAIFRASLADIIQKFADHHGRRNPTVILHALADITDIKLAARGKKGFEEKIAVVISPVAVARPGMSGIRSKPESAPSRVIAVIHSQKTNDPKGLLSWEEVNRSDPRLRKPESLPEAVTAPPIMSVPRQDFFSKVGFFLKRNRSRQA